MMKICDQPEVHATESLLREITELHGSSATAALEDPRMVIHFVHQAWLDREANRDIEEIFEKLSVEDTAKRFEEHISRAGIKPVLTLSLEGVQGPHGDWEHKVSVGTVPFDLRITTFPPRWSQGPVLLDSDRGRIVITDYTAAL